MVGSERRRKRRAGVPNFLLYPDEKKMRKVCFSGIKSPIISLWRTNQMFTFNWFLLAVLSLDSFGTHVRGKTGFITLSCVIKHAVICAQPAQASFPTQLYLAYHMTLGPFKRGLDVFQHKQKEKRNLNSDCFHSHGNIGG